MSGMLYCMMKSVKLTFCSVDSVLEFSILEFHLSSCVVECFPGYMEGFGNVPDSGTCVFNHIKIIFSVHHTQLNRMTGDN